ncbi:MAG TPA: acyl-CoA dehydrogenase family protein [Rhizomicrobium sp.]|jgi:alkylation response protein AidB-like acyl-CoA dehydrogenase
MDFALSDDHLVLRRSARDFLEKEIDLSPLLRPNAGVEEARYAENWQKLVELGWPGLIVPEAYGGSGLNCLDLVMIVSEMGRTLAPGPLFGTLAGTWAILKGGSETQKQAILPRVAGGGMKLALAISDRDGSSDGCGSDAEAMPAQGGYLLQGSKSFVVDAAEADLLVVAARHDHRRRFFLVDPRQAGVTIDVLPWRDTTRQVCNIRFERAKAELLAADDMAAWPWVRDRLLLVLAAESAAGLQSVLATTTEYARERVAFGKPIGAYQAIKHQLADMFSAGECANVAVLHAAWALSEETPQASASIAMAKSYACDAYVAATHQSIQIFGAIGFTWEMKNHLFFKRARANAEMLGAPATHRARVIAMLEQQAA